MLINDLEETKNTVFILSSSIDPFELNVIIIKVVLGTHIA